MRLPGRRSTPAPAATTGRDGSRPPAVRSRMLLGILFMLGASLSLTVMQTLVRQAAAQMHPFQISFFRCLFGAILLAPFLVREGITKLSSARFPLHIFRAALAALSMLTWFWCLAHVPLADATALSFVGIIMTSVGAVWLLGEALRAERLAAVLVGFLGACVVLQPGFQTISAGQWMALVSAAFWSGSVLCVKVLARTESPVTIVALMSMLVTVMTLPFAVAFWTWPGPADLAWLVAIGVLGTLGHLAVSKAMQLADASLVAPIDFSRLVWAGILGYLVFGELPSLAVVLGGLLIVASAAYLLRGAPR